MDNDVLEKIDNLTKGLYAREYFTKKGLNYEDALEIRERLKQKINQEQIDYSNIEMILNLIINKYCYDNNLTKTMENDINNSYEEKLMIYRINSNKSDVTCTNCKNKLIPDFKYCPYCGSENKQITLKLVTEGNIDLTKGFITPDEVQHIRFLTPDEEKLVNEGKVKFTDVGIALDETNCPYEIKKELISKDDNLRNNTDLRKKLYEENIKVHKKRVVNYQLSMLEDMEKARNIKSYPPSIIEEKNKEKISKIVQKDDEAPLIKPGEKRRKFIKIVSKPAISKTKEKIKEQKATTNPKDEYQQPIEDLNIDLKYAAILYLTDAVKHPTNPQISNDLLYWFNISSLSEITQYLRKNEYIVEAKGMDLIRANLSQLTQKEIKDILVKNNLKAAKSKDKNIDIILQNVERKKLDEYNKDNAIHVTKKGLDLIKENPQVETYSKYLYKFKPKSFEKLYQENRNNSLTDTALIYLSNMRDHYSEKMKWNRYALTYEAEYKIYYDNNDVLMQLRSYVNYFICMINPWDDNKLSYYNPVTISDNEELIKVVDKSKLSQKEVKNLFDQQVNDIGLPGLFLSGNKMYDYFKRIYENGDIRVINNELTKNHDLNSLEESSLEFFTKKEQEEVYDKVKELFN